MDVTDDFGEDELVNGLRNAIILFGHGGVWVRWGINTALMSVVRYLEDNVSHSGITVDKLLKPLCHLLEALKGLDRGERCQIFNPSRAKRGGTRLTTEEADLQLMCCLAAELLEEAGADSSEAAAQVAHKLTASGFYRHRKGRAGNIEKITAATVKGWVSDRARILATSSCRSDEELREWGLQYYLQPIGMPEFSIPETPVPRGKKGIANFILSHVIPLCFGHLRRLRHSKE